MINLKHYLKEGFVLIGTVWLLWILFRELDYLTTNANSVLSVFLVLLCLLAIKFVISDAVEKYNKRTKQ
jgi:hypothetical protein